MYPCMHVTLPPLTRSEQKAYAYQRLTRPLPRAQYEAHINQAEVRSVWRARVGAMPRHRSALDNFSHVHLIGSILGTFHKRRPLLYLPPLSRNLSVLSYAFR